MQKYTGGVSAAATISLGPVTHDMIDSDRSQSATALYSPSLLAAEATFKGAFVQDRELCRYVDGCLTVSADH